VSGLPEVTTLITVGQELVVPKQRVDVDYEPAPALPASTPPPQGAAPEARARVRAPAPAATGAELADAATT
jgi:hypothetical protein